MEQGSILGLPLASLGFGGVMGVAVGYATKKLGKLVLLAVGLVFLAVQWLAWEGWLHVDWASMEASAKAAWTDATGTTLAERAWQVVTADLPFGAAFAAGFALGVKLG